MKFTLEIELGNDAMQNANDVAWALERVVERLRGRRGELSAPFDPNLIRDVNGNRVGIWEIRA